MTTAEERYARYTPGQCYQHGVFAEWLYWNGGRRDTIPPQKWQGPRVREVVAAVRACVARFNAATVGRDELIYLGKTYVVAEQDSAADAAFQRLLKSSVRAPVSQRALELLQIVQAFAEGRPARLDRAMAYLARLDSLGAAAATERMLAHATLMGLAEAADSLPMVEDQAKQAIAAATLQSPLVRKQRLLDETSIRSRYAEWYARRFTLDSARASIRHTQISTVPLRPAATSWRLQALNTDYGRLGDSARPIQATHWFKNPGNVSYPVPGKVTLVMFVYASCRAACYPTYSAMQRLRAKYPPDKFAVVFVAHTNGYSQNKLLPPNEEAERIRADFHDRLKLDVPLAVWSTTFKQLPDGKYQRVSSPNVPYFFSALGNGVVPTVIIDPQGKIRSVTGLGESTERKVDGIIGDLLKR